MGTSGTHSEKQRTISVGILTSERVEFVLSGQFSVSSGGTGAISKVGEPILAEAQSETELVFETGEPILAVAEDGLVVIGGEAREEWYFAAGGQGADCQRLPNNRYHCSGGSDNQQSSDTQSVRLQAASCFTLKNVEIGKGFHWQRYQDQSFPGDLHLIARDGCVIAIKVVGIEDYLQCVIASEMSPCAGFEFLKAHAVISRSWLLAQLDKRDEVQSLSAVGKGAEGQMQSGAGKCAGAYSSVERDTPGELIRWQDREDHEWFDFCADDHCQRYQGIPMSMAAAMAPGAKSATTQGLTNNHYTKTEHSDSVNCTDTQADTLQGGARVDPAMLRKTRRVIEATWGQVLWYDGRVCDARFSKCCGGALEEFRYCWEDKEVPYLKYARDWDGGARIPTVAEPYASGSVFTAESATAGSVVAASPTCGSAAFESAGAESVVSKSAAGFKSFAADPHASKSVASVSAFTAESNGLKSDASVSASGVRNSTAGQAGALGLRGEFQARRWIMSSPRAFCNTRSKRLLSQVLKDYDSETKDFYRWTVEYSAEELRKIILERTGEDYGRILDLIPLERGVSGRIYRLKIAGSKKTKIIGKELEIRKTLSRSHLYSSAFVVEKVCNGDAVGNLTDNEQDTRSGSTTVGHHCFEQSAESKGVRRQPDGGVSYGEGQVFADAPAKFILHGAGWGHGVGLCQIGAAAMGARGYKYRDILQHYYPGSTISTLYGKE